MIPSYSVKAIPSYNYFQKIIPIEPISSINYNYNYNQNSNRLYLHQRNLSTSFLPIKGNVITPNTNSNHSNILSNNPLATKSVQIITTSYKIPPSLRIQKKFLEDNNHRTNQL